jgi:hypothetical protein
LASLYDGFKAAAEAILGIQNQPRAQGVDDLLEDEWVGLMEKAWVVAEHVKGLRPTADSRKDFLRVLVDSAFDMGADLEDADRILRDAMAAGVADDDDPGKRG